MSLTPSASQPIYWLSALAAKHNTDEALREDRRARDAEAYWMREHHERRATRLRAYAKELIEFAHEARARAAA